MLKKIIGIVVGVCFCSMQASAEISIFSCKFFGPSKESGNRVAAIDRAIVNYEANQIDLQVANTIGTKDQVNFLFEDGTVWNDKFQVRKAGGDDFVGVGTRIGGPEIVVMKNNRLTWVTINTRDNGEVWQQETIFICHR